MEAREEENLHIAVVRMRRETAQIIIRNKGGRFPSLNHEIDSTAKSHHKGTECTKPLWGNLCVLRVFVVLAVKS